MFCGFVARAAAIEAKPPQIPALMGLPSMQKGSFRLHESYGPNMTTQSPEYNEEMKSYFNSLPLIVQETIMQTGVKLCSLDELKECAQNLMEQQN